MLLQKLPLLHLPQSMNQVKPSSANPQMIKQASIVLTLSTKLMAITSLTTISKTCQRHSNNHMVSNNISSKKSTNQLWWKKRPPASMNSFLKARILSKRYSSNVLKLSSRTTKYNTQRKLLVNPTMKMSKIIQISAMIRNSINSLTRTRNKPNLLIDTPYDLLIFLKVA